MEQTSISSDLIRGHIDTIILYSLKAGDKFAGQISDYIEEKSNAQYKINQATLYSSLKRLESLKYVSSYMNDIEGGRRKFFKITQLGIDFVDKNLSSWTYSRAIIDKLIDTVQPEIKTVVYTQMPTENVNKTQENPSNFDSFVELSNDVNSKNDTKNDILQQNTEALVEDLIEKTETIKATNNSEVNIPDVQNDSSNFRSILNDLISSANKNKKTVIKEIKNELESEKQPKTEEKAVFKEVITDSDYNPNKVNNTGKINFGDLILNASSEGYKIKISSKDSALSHGNVLINKVKFFSVFLVYLISFSQIILLNYLANSVFAKQTIFIIVGALAIIPLYFFITFVNKPKLKIDKKFTGDKILTTLIVVFNLILITFALNFIFDVDYNNIKSVVYFTIIPILVFINYVLYCVFELIFASNKKFNKI